MIKVKFIGRGGQGAKTAAIFVAEAALEGGKNVQSFPEYGPERAGAPVKAYVRIDDKPIRVHEPITDPDTVVVIDSTLLQALDCTEGLSEDGMLLVNTPQTSEEVAKFTGFKGKIFTVDATKISIDIFGRNVPNTPMLGAFLKLTNVVPLDVLKKHVENKFLKKIGKDMTDKNIEAIDKVYEAVK